MQDVTVDRHLYIGGSDIPIIMGLSPYKKRFDLLLEKARLQQNDFEGNEYTEYGNVMEPKIRDYINSKSEYQFIEDKKIIGDIRCHVDGWNNKDTILEIKTTSQLHNSVDEYTIYLVQLLFYMYHYDAKGKLAVYARPKDFDEEFNEELLTEYDIEMNDYRELLDDILIAVHRFRVDLEKVKANPFITEEELQPKEVIELSNKVVAFENQLAAYKELEKQYKEVKQKLYDAMEFHKVKTWETNNGVRITRVSGSEDTTETVKEFNVSRFKKDFAELYDNYLEEKTVTKKGRAGSLRITMPKGE